MGGGASGRSPARQRARPGLTIKSLALKKFIGYPRAAGAGLYDSVIAACIASGLQPTSPMGAQIVTTLNLVARGWEFPWCLRRCSRLRLDAVVYRPMSARHAEGQLNLAVRDDALASPASAFSGAGAKGCRGAVRS